MGKLDGQIAFITGADSGIGRATALAFAREGAAVFILYHSDEEGARTAKEEVEASGGRAEVGRGDVGSEEDVDATFSSCVERLGPPRSSAAASFSAVAARTRKAARSST